VAAPNNEPKSCSSTARDSSTERIFCITKKAIGGTKYRAAASYGLAKDYASRGVQVSDSTAVLLTKTLSNGVATVSDRLLDVATPYLPEGLHKPAAALANYAHHWQDRVKQTNSAKEIWQAGIDETKNNYLLAQQLIVSVLKNNNLAGQDKKHQ